MRSVTEKSPAGRKGGPCTINWKEAARAGTLPVSLLWMAGDRIFLC